MKTQNKEYDILTTQKLRWTLTKEVRVCIQVAQHEYMELVLCVMEHQAPEGVERTHKALGRSSSYGGKQTWFGIPVH